MKFKMPSLLVIRLYLEVQKYISVSSIEINTLTRLFNKSVYFEIKSDTNTIKKIYEKYPLLQNKTHYFSYKEIKLS